MKSSILCFALVAGLAAAQSDKIPDCATSCVDKYATGDGIAGCKALDVACICKNDDFLNGVACCLEGKCDTAGKTAAVEYAKKICSAAKVDVPDSVVCKSSSSSASASASASASEKASESASGTAMGDASSSETGSAASASVSATASSDSTETASATEAAASSTSSTDAAAGLSSASGLLGAIAAMLMAL
ncbi:hypothetical protein G7Z17_g9119 [Cylindrodendrum hubeiense]|uniref:CFEM domain-containing protein n=1 Tax=Cylindrodendrum hubeiense TaxID=595255 RepID=A0A9P5H8F9_9HYPO|nr:hypothetical protein G7Z17_g9119 [Cylindrodendrum hubeiense]